jgi:hypothetical protein
LIREEIGSTVKLPLKKRLWAWRHGFLSKNIVIYNLNRTNVNDYLSDVFRIVNHPFNGIFSDLIDNKLYLPIALHSFKQYIPEYYYLLKKDFCISLTNKKIQACLDPVINICSHNRALILKPCNESGGRGVFLLKKDESGKMLLNGTSENIDSIYKHLSALNNYIVTEYIEQHDYSRSIFHKSANTIRIMTMWDYEEYVPFIARAVHRFGVESSAPVDNWCSGGLSCSIDLETGEIGKAVSHPKNDHLTWYKFHPDTKHQIEGVVIPGWNSIKTQILEMARELAFVPYMGWDILVTEDRFKVIEINSLPDLIMPQAHGPLAKGPRIRKFYNRYRR